MPRVSCAGQPAYYVHRRGRSGSPVHIHLEPVTGPTGIPAQRPHASVRDGAAPAPVLFLHGAGGTHQLWLSVIHELEHTPSYAVDLPGHGRSEGPGRDSIPAYGDWLISFLEASHLEQVVLVGHSMGGGLALDVALRYPSRVAALGLIATGARLRVAPAVLDGIRRDPAAVVALICRSVFGPCASQTNLQLGERQLAATPPEVLYGDFVACDVFDVRERLAEIRCPTCIVCGALDQLTPLKYSIYLRDQIAGAELCSIEGCGHMVMLEQPQAVARALDSWLDGLKAG